MTAQGVHAQGIASIDGQAITDESVSRILECRLKRLCDHELDQVGFIKRLMSWDTRKLYSKVRARHSSAHHPRGTRGASEFGHDRAHRDQARAGSAMSAISMRTV